MRLWRLRLGAVIAVTVLGLTGCASGSDGSSPSASGPSQPIRIGAFFALVDSLDPATVTSPGSMLLAFDVYGSLAVMAKKGAALSLTESIEPNTTAGEWTVTLRNGLTYPDDTAATGQDVLGSPSHFAQSPSCATLYLGIDLEVSSTSGSTATLELKKPTSGLLRSSLGMFSATAPKGKFTDIGAGPSVVDRGDLGTGYQLHADDGYWNNTPSIPQVTMAPVPDSTAQISALRTGEIDLAIGLNSAALTILSGASNVRVADATLESVFALELALGTRVAPFNDSEVRYAAKFVADWGRLVNTILGSTDKVASNALDKDYDNYPEDVARTVANKEEAKHIFAEERVTSFTIVAAGVISGVIPSAESMTQKLAGVRVWITVDKRDSQTYYSNLEELRRAQMMIVFWISRNPIIEFRNQVIPDCPSNLSGFTPETIRQNLAKVTATLDMAEQRRLVGEIGKKIRDQGGDLIRGHQRQVLAYRVGLENSTSVQSVPWLMKVTFNSVG